MCYYITAVVPDQVHLEKIQKMLKSYNLEFNEIINPYILNQLSNRYRYFRPTTSTCDCDSELGKSNGYQKNKHKSAISKLQKKGWSQSKIDRWIEERKNYKIKTDPKVESSNKMFWHQFIVKFLKTNLSNEFGLLVHWYEKNLEDENFHLKNIQKIKFESISDFNFSKIEYDTLYLFVRSFDKIPT
ncbi:hypothetical protein [Leptospira santarosai]|uniref:hypothetical protein n=1 Tax=Leptospira santarosai TaxID=28183 RepID=UPI0024AEA654|nr:hypothetical protein [Leptospira santarosai]MDI7189493.1 hypothetical protein [Leptospira santarosai]MDI7221945.1 hypothetical protein [Leptospira santarosai]